ncbi:hypothetical protein [Roseivivax marinus]|uniref:hypothetical protein n=1 Tax=Roseivivax marinus TaxID=1379903 RepID=UPI00273F5DED|nr:hypothetical protein [Roseivivax marinus]
MTSRSIEHHPEPPKVHRLRPRRIGELALDYCQGAEEVGGIDVLIWDTPERMGGHKVHCRDWPDVHKLVRSVREWVAQ